MNNNLFVKFGRGFSEPNLRNMRKFYITYSQTQIQQKPSAKFPQFTLSWSHYHVTVHDEQDAEQVKVCDKQKLSDSIEQVTASTEHVTDHDTIHVTIHDREQVIKLILALDEELSRLEIMNKLKLTNRAYFVSDFIQPAINEGIIEMTLPDKPQSKQQKYRLTAKGKVLKEKLGGLNNE